MTIYFDESQIPESPEEPDPEYPEFVEPKTIHLEKIVAHESIPSSQPLSPNRYFKRFFLRHNKSFFKD